MGAALLSKFFLPRAEANLLAFCFHHLTNPFTRNSFIFTSIQIPRGVGVQPTQFPMAAPTLCRTPPGRNFSPCHLPDVEALACCEGEHLSSRITSREKIHVAERQSGAYYGIGARIGRAIARLFAQEGASVFLCARSEPE